MENRQERLEAKVKSLSTTARMLGLFGGLLTGLGILAGVLMGGIWVAGLVAGADTRPWMPGVGSCANALALGWVLLQLRDAFTAIVDIIGELSETV